MKITIEDHNVTIEQIKDWEHIIETIKNTNIFGYEEDYHNSTLKLEKIIKQIKEIVEQETINSQ